MTSSNLVPTPITDKNGKATTVYRRPEQAEVSHEKGFPSPVATAYIPPKRKKKASVSYEERCENIQAANKKWRSGDKPSVVESAQRAADAMEVVGNLMIGMTANTYTPSNEDLAMRISDLGQSRDYAAIILADRFAAVHQTITEAGDGDTEWDEPFEVTFDGEDTSHWESDDAGVSNNREIIDMVFTLRDLDLLSYTETPEHGDVRFFAHLYMSASRTVNYRMDDPDVLSIIRLVDEFPERTAEIAEAKNYGVGAEGIKSMLSGTTPSGIASGVL